MAAARGIVKLMVGKEVVLPVRLQIIHVGDRPVMVVLVQRFRRVN